MICYVIDGHNTIHSVSHYLNLLDKDYPSCLRTLIADCSNYCISREITMILVFDGNPPFDMPAVEGLGISIIFSGKQRDADSIIIEKAIPPKSTTVVTNDRAVKRQTAASGCKHLSPKSFFELISSPTQVSRDQKEPFEKNRALTDREFLWWKNEIEEEMKKKK